MKSFLQALTRHHFLFFIVVSFVLYGNTLGNKYALDDSYVANNELTNKGFKGIPKIFKTHYAINENGNNYEYRPIVKATFAVEYQFFKENPFVSHLVNILLYGVCLYLLFNFLRSFLRHQSVPGLLLTVCVFAVLPVHTEVVASLKNRDILLAFIFTMLAIGRMDRFFESNRLYDLFLSMLFVLAGFLSKLDILSFALIGPPLFFNKYSFKRWRTILLCGAVFLSAFLLLVVMKKTLLDKSIQLRLYNGFENPLYKSHHLLLMLGVALNSLGFYIKSLLLPYNLSCYYGSYTIPTGLFSGYALVGVCGLVFLSVVFIRNRREGANLRAGILLFVFPISMYFNIIRLMPGIVGDRLCFFASVGFTIIVCHYLLRSQKGENPPARFKDLRASFRYILAAFFIISAVMVVARNRDWKNKLTLYETDIKKWPGSVKLNVLYANEIIGIVSGRDTKLIPADKSMAYISKARQHLETAYRLDSSYYNIANSLAYVEMTFYNRPQEAVLWLYKAARHDSTNYEIPLNLCLCYARMNKLDSMEKYYVQTARLKSENIQKLRQFMSGIYATNGRQAREKAFFTDHGYR